MNKKSILFLWLFNQAVNGLEDSRDAGQSLRTRSRQMPLDVDSDSRDAAQSLRGSPRETEEEGRREMDFNEMFPIDSDFRIVGGTVVTTNETYPYFVQGQGCGGSLIAPRVVLTAAHCSSSRFSLVKIGGIEKYNDGQQIVVSSQVVHPNYVGQKNDFRLLFLAEAPSGIDPVPLNTDNAIPAVDAWQTVIGTGHTSEGGYSSDVLREADVRHIANELCSSHYGSIYDKDIMLCAMVPGGGTDACQGDSGGPIMDKETGKQVGVVSWGAGCARPNAAGVYARVSAVYPWIRDEICKHTPEDCPSVVDNTGGDDSDTDADSDSDNDNTGINTEVDFRVKVRHDKYPTEVSWMVRDQNGKVILRQNVNEVRTKFQTVVKTARVPTGTYTVDLEDGYGDGLREVEAGEEPGYVEVYVDGKLVKKQDAYYTSKSQLSINVDAGDETDNGNTGDGAITYGIDVKYDSYPHEFRWKVIDVTDPIDNVILHEVEAGAVRQANLHMTVPLNFVPGRSYRLRMDDEYGDGLQWKNGYARVWYKMNGVTKYLVDDSSHFTLKRINFEVPADLRVEARAGGAQCIDSSKLFEVNGHMSDQSCAWLNENWNRYSYLCDLVQVASACPRTCESCDLFKSATTGE